MHDKSIHPTATNATSGRRRRWWALGIGVVAAACLTFAVGAMVADSAEEDVSVAADSPPPAAAEPSPEADGAEADGTEVDSPSAPAIHEVSAMGTPLSLSLDAGWRQTRSVPGEVIFTYREQSVDGYNRRVIFLRPHGLSDPAQPQVFGPGWPVDDIDGWLDNIVDGIVVDGPQPVEIGGRNASYFEAEITDLAVCGTASFCAGFVANTYTPGPQNGGEGVISGWAFLPGFHDRIWWIDQGTEAPLVIIAQTASTDRDFQPTADALLDTLTIGDPRPHPVPFEDSGLTN